MHVVGFIIGINEQLQNFSKPTGIKKNYLVLAKSKYMQNLLKEFLRNHKKENFYDRCKIALVPSLKQFATKTVRGGVGKAARILDPGSRQISMDSFAVFKMCSDYQMDTVLSSSHQFTLFIR